MKKSKRIHISVQEARKLQRRGVAFEARYKKSYYVGDSWKVDDWNFSSQNMLYRIVNEKHIYVAVEQASE